MSLGRARPLFVTASLLFLLGLSAAAGAAGRGGSPKPVDPYANDPRSGAALNRDAALHPAAAPPPLFGPGPQTILPGTVNDPSADQSARDTQSETTVTGLGSDVVVGFNDSGSSRGGRSKFTGYSHSGDGGARFTDEGALPTNSFGDAGDPNLVAGEASGAIYFSTLAFNVTNAIPVFKSTNGGVSFHAPVNAIRGGLDLDKDWMAVDNFPGAGNGTIYVCATDFGFDPARIVVTHSVDGGAKFNPFGGVVVSHAGQSQGCALAVAPDHSLYVAFFRGNRPNRLFIRRSTDGGNSFGAAHEVATLNTTSINGDLDLAGGFRTNSFPSLAVNPASGQVDLAYNDLTAPGDADIYATASDDRGKTWSAPIVVNNDTAGDQYFPAVAISPNGKRAFFGYYSRADDPSNTLFGRRGRLFNAHPGGSGALTPSGRSFRLGANGPPVVGQDPVINETYMGDYDQAFAAADGSFYSSWADNVDGDAFHANQPDVRFARIAPAQPTADARVTLGAAPSMIAAGDATTITAHVRASGGTANDVVLNMSPARGLAFESASSAGNHCDLVDGFVGCTMGDIPAGTVETVKVVARGGLPGGAHVVRANVTTSSRDTDGADDTGTTTVDVDASGITAQTFSSGDISVPIPDQSTVDVPLTVGPAGAIADIDAFVRLNHTFDSDLEISLISPLGTTVDLSSNNGGSGHNYGAGTLDCAGAPTRFDDGATTSITTASPPFAGSFRPQQPLATLNGEEESGTWTLRVTDDAAQDTGTIGCAKLRIARF